MRFTRRLAAGVAALLAVIGAESAGAQGLTTGAIAGQVTDDAGRLLENAQIEIRNVSTGYRSALITRANGRYFAQGLAVGGPYTVTIRLIGYRPFIKSEVEVLLGQTAVVDAKLEAAPTQLEAVSVTAAANEADFSPTRQGVATIVSDTMLRRLPQLQRDYVDFTKLTPQVVRPADGGGASAGGVYNRFNNYTVDGVNQNDRFSLGSSGGTPGGATSGRIMSIEAVKEFQVLMSPTDVRYGNFAGMLVNAVTKSGTNTFTGGATYAFRTPGMAASEDFIKDSDFDVANYGFSLGGPIIKDKLHFFVAPEWQRRNDPAAGPSANLGTGLVGDVSLDSIARIQSIMQSNYGVDVGSAGTLRRNNPLDNLFGRIDWQINDRNRLAFRQLYNTAEQDEFSRNLGSFNTNVAQQNSGIRLTSNAFSRLNTNISSALQFFTISDRGWSNEISAGYNTIRDERIVPINTPEVAVAVTPVGGTSANRAVTFGTERFSPGNDLKQRILEISDNFTMPFANHTITVGGRYERTYIYNYFLSGAANGAFVFPNIDALAAGTPSGYAFSYANGGDIAAEFNGQQISAYAQDLWTINDRLTVTYGLRVDVPSFLDSPVLNDDILTRSTAAGLPVRTDWKPKSTALWSPRVGFNWDVNGDKTTQLRGNVGVFTSPVPYIMVGNAYANTGLGGVTVACTAAGQVPAFSTDVAALPTSCVGQPAPVPGAAGTVGINTVDPNFKNPQNFTSSLGFDRLLPGGVLLSLEGLYRKAINGVFVEDLNLRGPREVTPGLYYLTNNRRVIYADTITVSGTGSYSAPNANQRRILQTGTGASLTNFNEGIIHLTNQSADYSYSLSSQLKKRFNRAFEATVAYTYMQSKDAQSLTSDRAISNYRNGRQTDGVVNEKRDVGTSYFERPHRIIAFGTYTAPWVQNQTDITFFFEGISGTPLTYVTSSDINGDGVNGNDPIYIPRDATDPTEMRIGTGSGAAYALNAQAAQDFEDFIQKQACLNEHRGTVMQRNSCRSPFQQRLDMSIRQSLPQLRGHALTLQLDIVNVPNLINRSWGQLKLPALSPVFPQQQILTVRNRTAGPISDETALGYEFDSRLRGREPFVRQPNSFRDWYQMQLTLRYAF
ncbi:MAG TPA: TonB-dependent receptor [Gemmatimonadaceae bacterium]|nr:TonB-dependent receptor [Gemmatimonadaceae bacterium]